MVASAQMQSGSLCDLFLTARDQTGTGLYWQSVATRPRKRIPLPTHPALPWSWLCLWASQYKTHSDLLQQFHLMDKKRPRQPGWFSLKRRKQMGKILLESSSTYLQYAEEAELGSSQRQGTNAAAWEILLMLLRSFHLVWWERILCGKAQNYC